MAALIFENKAVELLPIHTFSIPLDSKFTDNTLHPRNPTSQTIILILSFDPS